MKKKKCIFSIQKFDLGPHQNETIQRIEWADTNQMVVASVYYIECVSFMLG